MCCNMYYVGQHTSTTHNGGHREHGYIGSMGTWVYGVFLGGVRGSQCIINILVKDAILREVAASLLNELKISYSY